MVKKIGLAVCVFVVFFAVFDQWINDYDKSEAMVYSTAATVVSVYLFNRLSKRFNF